MDLGLNGKTALVTASTAGIGFAIAKLLRHEGAEVIVNGRSQERVSHAIAALKQSGPVESPLTGFVGDLASLRDQERLFSEVPAVDILINNLGVFEALHFDDISRERWNLMWNTNVMSGAMLSQHYLPTMLKQNWGRMIFIASETGVNVPKDMIHYGVSKAAQIALARGLAETTTGTNVTVNSVLPGPTRSEGISKFLSNVLGESADSEASEREFLLKLRPTSLIQRFASPDEVASIVTYLASERSSATNGAALRVEGGLLRNAL